MRRFAAVLAVFFGFASAAFGAPATMPAALTLVQDGQPKALIVVPAKALEPLPARKGSRPLTAEAGAAKMLSDHLFLMSGARLAIKEESDLGAAAVAGGRLSFDGGKVPAGIETFVLVGEGEAARKLGMTSEGLGAGGMLVKTGGNVLALLGSDSAADKGGTRYAAIEFLESLGVRYLWPGESGRVIPKMATVTVGALDRRFTPPISQRQIRLAGGLSERPAQGLAHLELAREEWEAGRTKAFAMDLGVAWSAWQRLGGSIGIAGGAAGGGLRGGWTEHGKDHPEWFALQKDGTRDQSKAAGRYRLCVSNPGLIEFVSNDIIERVSKDPSITCVSLCPNDGGWSSFCMCENCKKLDPLDAPKIKFPIVEKVGDAHVTVIDYVSLTDRYVWYWNQVAERVTRVHPKLLLLGEAYSLYSTPPVREKLNPNLVIRYVPSGTEGWEGWQKAGCKRIYWRPNILGAGRRDGKLNVMAQILADTMRFMAGHGTIATDFDAIIDYWAVQGLNYYACARLNWNPNLTVDEILESYCRPGFGPGADSIKRYFLRAQEITSALSEASRANKDLPAGAAATAPREDFTPATVAELRGLLDQADRAAGKDDGVRERIAFLRMGLNFTDLQTTITRMSKQAADKAPGLDRARAAKLLELDYMMLRDIVKNHSLALNCSYLMWGNSDNAPWEALGGRGYRPSKARLELAAPEGKTYTLTGHENNLDEMIVSLGLNRPVAASAEPAKPRPRKGKGSTIVDADENGRAVAPPAR